MKKLGFAFVAILTIALFSNAAFAGLVIDITGPSGVDVKTVAPGTIQGEVWATVTGTDADPTNEYLLTVTGGIQLTGSGTFETFVPSQNYVGSFIAYAGNGVDTGPQLIGHGGLTTITGTGIFAAKSNLTSNPFPGVQGQGSYKIATFTVDNAAPGDTIQFLKSGAAISMYSFRCDGTNYNGSSTSGYNLVTVGAPLTVVPEPATFVLLGMGALALVFIRRRK